MWKAIVKMLEKRACHHDWEVLHKRDYEDQAPTRKWSEGTKAHTRIVLMCKKCGEIKTIIV